MESHWKGLSKGITWSGKALRDSTGKELRRGSPGARQAARNPGRSWRGPGRRPSTPTSAFLPQLPTPYLRFHLGPPNPPTSDLSLSPSPHSRFQKRNSENQVNCIRTGSPFPTGPEGTPNSSAGPEEASAVQPQGGPPFQGPSSRPPDATVLPQALSLS